MFFQQQFSGFKVKVLNTAVQASGSFTCGGYVIYFRFCLSKKCNISQILEVFAGNLKNDVFIKNFIYSITGTKGKCFDMFCNKIMFDEKCPTNCDCK